MFTAVIQLGSEISHTTKGIIEERVGVVPIESDSIAVEREGQVTVDFESPEEAADEAASLLLDAVREIMPEAFLEAVHPNG